MRLDGGLELEDGPGKEGMHWGNVNWVWEGLSKAGVMLGLVGFLLFRLGKQFDNFI